MSSTDFPAFFRKATAHEGGPREWQSELAASDECRSRLIRIPTGYGKTAGVLAAWLFHRVQRQDDRWPRRLVWCLPMRVLVEQTVDVARVLTSRLAEEVRPEVSQAMGGEDIGEWFLYPEKTAILIGTQDMLLSRGLNRGYASGRARWPMEFGLLNHDALWVMDEVQLMDVGLATSAQLQAFRDEDKEKALRPCHTWWMSATLQPEWLKSVDTVVSYATWSKDPCVVPSKQRKGGLWDVKKSIATDAVAHKDTSSFAQRILSEHAKVTSTEFGRITLVICNTVERACDTYRELRMLGRTDGLELVHSRFRPAEREDWRKRFLSRDACSKGVDRIIVATQVVEAGVDISAGCLITELAPWPSLVQRFGRCARYGGSGTVVVIDRGRDEKVALPYATEELDTAWNAIRNLTDVGIESLEAYEESLADDARQKLYPYAPAQLLLRREFDELFDTTPDLTGADLDISRFIRTGDERDVQVFWLDLGKDDVPKPKRQAQRRELCSVPFLKARNWLCGEETKTNRKPKLHSKMRAWTWDWLDGKWIESTRDSLRPGRVVCVASHCGGYDRAVGFDPQSKEIVAVVPPIGIPKEVAAIDDADSKQDGEELSENDWKTIRCHSSEVMNEVAGIADMLGLSAGLKRMLLLAGQWHDIGKSHPAFQGALRHPKRPERFDLAKGPKEAWLRPPGTYRIRDNSDSRPAFRHELASALALFSVLERFAPQHPALLGPWKELFAATGRAGNGDAKTESPSATIQHLLSCTADEFDLLAYLVASHHGKVRIALHAAPKDQDYVDSDLRGLPIRGVRERDELPAVAIGQEGEDVPALFLTLEPAAMGLSSRTGTSWRERCLKLLKRLGPAHLAYLEAVFRAADVRASQLSTIDPELGEESAQ